MQHELCWPVMDKIHTIKVNIPRLCSAGHHTIYIGVHVPKSYRRRRRHRRRPGHKEKKEKISENYSDKSDVENADETSSSILKPLSKYGCVVSLTTVLCCLVMCSWSGDGGRCIDRNRQLVLQGQGRGSCSGLEEAQAGQTFHPPYRPGLLLS